MDDTTPRYLYIAGEVTNVRGLQKSATEATGEEFGAMRIGSLGVLRTMIKWVRTLMPKSDEVFPPWQGMQYLHDMFTGLPKLNPNDNNRYGHRAWTSVKDILKPVRIH